MSDVISDPVVWVLVAGIGAIYLYGEWYWRFGSGRYKTKPARKSRRRI